MDPSSTGPARAVYWRGIDVRIVGGERHDYGLRRAGFFEPNPLAFLGMQVRLGSEHAGYYSTKPLEHTLEELIDPAQLNVGEPRLTVGAANVQTAQMQYFDSRDTPLTIRHIMASGALPPAFPAVRIGEELYWDGGVLSNTPVEVVFDESPRRSGLIFAVHMWAPNGPEPDSIGKVLARQKDLQYSSRAATHIARQKQLHRLRHVIMELAAKLPHEVANSPEVHELASYGCVTRMHVVRLLAPPLAGEDHSKDIDFSPTALNPDGRPAIRILVASSCRRRGHMNLIPWKA